MPGDISAAMVYKKQRALPQSILSGKIPTVAVLAVCFLQLMLLTTGVTRYKVLVCHSKFSKLLLDTKLYAGKFFCHSLM